MIIFNVSNKAINAIHTGLVITQIIIELIGHLNLIKNYKSIKMYKI